MQDKRFNVNALTKVLKILIPLVSFLIIIYQVKSKGEINKQFVNDVLTSLDIRAFLLILLSLGLVFFNWGSEAIKWKFLISKIESISFKTAFKAVTVGITASIIIPFHAGEYLGRIAFLKYKIRGAILTTVCSISQILITFLFGLISLIFFNMDIQGFDMFWIIIMTLFVALMLLYSLINFDDWFGRFLPIKIRKYFKVLSLINDKRLLLKVFLLSVFRFIVFTVQYIIIFKCYGLPFSEINLFFSISLMYISMTFIPINKVLELGTTRSLILISLFQLLPDWDSKYEMLVVLSTFTIWLFNIVIPASYGGVVMLLKKVD